MAGVIRRISILFQRFDNIFTAIFHNNQLFPPEAAALCLVGVRKDIPSTNNFDLKSILNDAFLWAVPKKRRSIEKRWKRRFGHSDYQMKILSPRKDLKTCNVCGDDHQVGVLCPTCYKRVIDETKAMQETIQNELKLDPIEKEVVVLYDGEKDEKPDEYWEGKRLVEMKKERPSWFSKNLLQQTTQKNATSTDVKPTDLG